MFVAGVLLAAGGSSGLGRPKQLLAYRDGTLLDCTLNTARACGFDQLLVTLGGAADQVRAQVDLSGATVVENLYFATGCGASIAAAVGWIDPRADGVVVLLGGQPGVRASSVRGLLDVVAPDSIGVCRYQDGLGHPLWIGRELFDELATLRGDRTLWTLLHSGRYPVAASRVDGAVPTEVDTWEDYEALVRG